MPWIKYSNESKPCKFRNHRSDQSLHHHFISRKNQINSQIKFAYTVGTYSPGKLSVVQDMSMHVFPTVPSPTTTHLIGRPDDILPPPKFATHKFQGLPKLAHLATTIGKDQVKKNSSIQHLDQKLSLDGRKWEKIGAFFRQRFE